MHALFMTNVLLALHQAGNLAQVRIGQVSHIGLANISHNVNWTASKLKLQERVYAPGIRSF